MSGEAERNGEAPTGDDSVGDDTLDGHDDIAAANADSADTATDALAELQAKAAENWDKYLRSAAELDNVRKRAARDVENARRFALERFAGEILGVLDSLEMGIAAGTDAGAEALLDGSQATLKLLTTTMENFGISELDPLGEPFDPEYHEAMTMQPSADAEPGSVLTVYQKGYTLNGRLLRPARVVVAQSVPAGEDGG